MKGTLVDSNVVQDVFLNDLKWTDWSQAKPEEYSDHASLYINSIIYSEISIGFKLIEDSESAIGKTWRKLPDIPKKALFFSWQGLR